MAETSEEIKSDFELDSFGLDEDLSSFADEDEHAAEVADWLHEVGDSQAARAPETERQVRGLLNDYADAHTEGGEAGEFLERAKAAVQSSPNHQHTPDREPMFALITMGLGSSAILNYLREARTMDVPVVFVLQGFDPDEGLQGLVDDVLEINSFEIEFDLHVNPVIFNEVNAERVPVFVHTGEDGVTRIRRGAVNLHAAHEAMTGDELDLVIGETFEVDEPNMLDIIHDRIENLDGEQLIADATERARKRFIKGLEDLPDAQQDDSYLVDPAIELTRDITLPDGRMVAARGTVVNPLEFAPWSEQFVIFDATQEWQVEQAEHWGDEASVPTTYIASELPEDEQERTRLGERLNGKVHLLEPLIVRRMDLRAVPSRASQDGLMVRIDVAAKN